MPLKESAEQSAADRHQRSLRAICFAQGKIPQPLANRPPPIDLPKIYEDYLNYQQTHQQATARLISSIKRVLVAFDQYLQMQKIDLGSLKIEQVDAFAAEFFAPFAAASCRIYRCRLRGFLKYLYHERSIIKRDLAPLVVGRREYSQAKPPKFLRPQRNPKTVCRFNHCQCIRYPNLCPGATGLHNGTSPQRDQPNQLRRYKL